jgi:hypothetical protein
MDHKPAANERHHVEFPSCLVEEKEDMTNTSMVGISGSCASERQQKPLVTASGKFIVRNGKGTGYHQDLVAVDDHQLGEFIVLLNGKGTGDHQDSVTVDDHQYFPSLPSPQLVQGQLVEGELIEERNNGNEIKK